MASDKSYTMTDEQLRTLLAEVRANAPAAPTSAAQLTADEQVNALVKQIREGENRPVHKIERLPCKSEETGATFVAVVQTSGHHPAGFVLTLDAYTMPDGVEVHKADGGLVPDGLTVRRKDGELTREYKQWVWVNFYQADLRRHVGKDGAWIRKMAAPAL